MYRFLGFTVWGLLGFTDLECGLGGGYDAGEFLHKPLPSRKKSECSRPEEPSGRRP